MIVLEPLIESIKKELGSNFFTEAHGEIDLYRYINSAINYVWKHRDWTWSKNIYSFSYPEALVEVEIIYCLKIFAAKLDDKLIDVVDSQGWFMATDHTSHVGIYWDKFIATGTWIYQLLYTPIAPRVDKGSTSIGIPEIFEDVIRILAVSFGYKDVKKYDKSSPLIGEANAFLDGLAERTSVPLPTQDLRLWSNTSWN